MIRAGFGILVIVAVAGMLAGGGIALRPFLFRETVTLESFQADTPETAAFARGVRLALEEHEFRAGVFRVRHENVPPTGPRYWSSYQPSPEPHTVRFPPISPHYYPLYRPLSPRPDRDPGYFRRCTADPGEGERTAGWAMDGGIRSVYVLADQFDTPDVPLGYSTGSTFQLVKSAGSSFLRAASKTGLSIAGTEIVPQTDFEYRHLVARVARWKTDMVYVDAGGRGGRLVSDLRARGYRGRILLSSRSVACDFAQFAGRAAIGTYSTWAIEPPPPADFDAKHRARYGLPADPNSHSGYAETLAYLEAIGHRSVRGAADLNNALQTMLDPIVDPDRFAVYACRAGRFELVTVLP